MNTATETKHTYRKEYGELCRLGFPVLMTQLGVILMSFTDTMMVGAYGVEELASSAFVNSMFLIPLVMLSGLAAGVTPLVGALFSRGEKHEAGRTARAGLQINLIVSLSFMALMAAIYFCLDLFGQPAELMPVIRPYYITLLFTLTPMALFNVFSQTSNGITDTRSPMWMILGAIALNILGNWLLIFGHWGFPELGLTGAGIATVAARFAGLAGIAGIYLFRRKYKPYLAGIKDGAPLGTLRSKVWHTSYPVMIQSGLECALWSFGAVACGWFGKIQLAAYQVVNTLGQIGFMTYTSIGVAISIRVANYTGVHDAQGSRYAAIAGLHLNLLLATIASILILVISKPLIGIFTSDSDVIAAGLLFVPPLVLYQYLDATQINMINAIRGTSKVKPLLWIAIVSYIAVGIPSAILFSVNFGLEGVGVYYSFCFALLTASVMAWIAFKRILNLGVRL